MVLVRWPTTTFCSVLLLFSGCSRPLTRFAASDGGDSELSGLFMDSAHHWYDIRDEEHVIDPLPDQQRYPADHVREIADNILLYQRSNGGWPKNYDMRAILSPGQRGALERSRDDRTTTFDNGATHSQVRFLARAFTRTGDRRYREACLRGVEFILRAQYPNGGWPQFFPDTSGYRKYITFNDGAMAGVLRVLQRITEGDADFSFVPDDLRSRARTAFTQGIACVLRCQIVDRGQKTVWCQQHDERDFRPRSARSFEPAALCSMESAELVVLLMSLKAPSPEVINAIQDAVTWFDRSTLRGIRVETVSAPERSYQYHRTNADRVVVEDPAAPPLWARFYELDTGRPLFCNRDGKPVYSLAEVDRERRTGYAWYTEAPSEVLKTYPRWQKQRAQSVLGGAR